MKTSTRGAAALAIAAMLVWGCGFVSGPVRADTTVKEKTVFDGLGEKGRLASEGTSTITVSGDKLRQETTTKFTGKFMKRFGGEEGMKSASITRIDRRLTYQVDYRDKSYTEIPFESLKDLQNEMAAAGREESPDEEEKEPPLKCDPIRLEGKATGQKQDVNGFPGEEAVVTGTQVCRNEETKQTCTNHYTLDYWVTPVTPQLAELQDFHLKMAKAMGLDMREMQALAQAAQGMMSQLTEGFGALYKELSKVQGYPVRSRIVVEKEGDCGMVAAGGEGVSPSPGSEIKAIGGRIKGLFGKKKEGEGEPQHAAKGSAAPAGRRKVFGMSTELLSVGAEAAPGDAFEPPAGFKKKEISKS